MGQQQTKSIVHHDRTKSFVFLGLVLATAVVAAFIIRQKANEPQDDYQSPALMVSKQRAQTITPVKKITPPKTGTK